MGLFSFRAMESNEQVEQPAVESVPDPVKSESLDIDPPESESTDDSDADYEDIKRAAEKMLQQELEELNNHHKNQPRTQHELAALPPVEKIAFEWGPRDTIEVLGEVHHIMDDLVVIKARTAVQPDQEDKNSLNVTTTAIEEGSVLCLGDRTIIGQVFEIFGPVRQPFYSIRFNNSSEIPSDVKLGVEVYYPVQRCSRIFAAQIYSKGCDASDEFNEEIPEHLMEFSDDEEEHRAQANRKAKRRRASAQRVHDATLGKRNVVEYDEFATEPLGEPPSREIPLKKRVATSVQDILGQETEGEVKRSALEGNSSEDVVGFFEPLPAVDSGDMRVNLYSSLIVFIYIFC